MDTVGTTCRHSLVDRPLLPISSSLLRRFASTSSLSPREQLSLARNLRTINAGVPHCGSRSRPLPLGPGVLTKVPWSLITGAEVMGWRGTLIMHDEDVPSYEIFMYQYMGPSTSLSKSHTSHLHPRVPAAFVWNRRRNKTGTGQLLPLPRPQPHRSLPLWLPASFLCLSSGRPVFSHLSCPRPHPILYLLTQPRSGVIRNVHCQCHSLCCTRVLYLPLAVD